MNGTKDTGLTGDFEAVIIISITQVAEDYGRPVITRCFAHIAAKCSETEGFSPHHFSGWTPQHQGLDSTRHIRSQKVADASKQVKTVFFPTLWVAKFNTPGNSKICTRTDFYILLYASISFVCLMTKDSTISTCYQV